MHRRRNEERFAAETTPVPLLTLFALKALLDLEALNSNNVRGGTCLAEVGGAKKSGWRLPLQFQPIWLGGGVGCAPYASDSS